MVFLKDTQSWRIPEKWVQVLKFYSDFSRVKKCLGKGFWENKRNPLKRRRLSQKPLSYFKRNKVRNAHRRMNYALSERLELFVRRVGISVSLAR